MTGTPDVSDEHHKFQLRAGAARMLSLVELPIGNLTSDCNHQVCDTNILSAALPDNKKSVKLTFVTPLDCVPFSSVC
jgi:hypothetical protein